MFGMEKKTKKPFEFDLEKDMKKDAKKKKEVFDHIQESTNQLKTALREGSASENFDQCGLLLQAYAATQKVLNKASKS